MRIMALNIRSAQTGGMLAGILTRRAGSLSTRAEGATVKIRTRTAIHPKRRFTFHRLGSPRADNWYMRLTLILQVSSPWSERGWPNEFLVSVAASNRIIGRPAYARSASSVSPTRDSVKHLIILEPYCSPEKVGQVQQDIVDIIKDISKAKIDTGFKHDDVEMETPPTTRALGFLGTFWPKMPPFVRSETIAKIAKYEDVLWIDEAEELPGGELMIFGNPHPPEWAGRE